MTIYSCGSAKAGSKAPEKGFIMLLHKASLGFIGPDLEAYFASPMYTSWGHWQHQVGENVRISCPGQFWLLAAFEHELKAPRRRGIWSA